MGYRKDQATAHGFRSTASTILNERGYSPDVIESALAHQDENEVRRIYNRALYLPERKKLGRDLSRQVVIHCPNDNAARHTVRRLSPRPPRMDKAPCRRGRWKSCWQCRKLASLGCRSKSTSD